MFWFLFVLFVVVWLIIVVGVFVQDMIFIYYLEICCGDVVEMLFGEMIVDFYCWFENDVCNDIEVVDWVMCQNCVMCVYFDVLLQCVWFEMWLCELMNYECFGLLVKVGGCYFYMCNIGFQNQVQFFVCQGLCGMLWLLFDFNVWVGDQVIVFDDWKLLNVGCYLFYSVQDGGIDWCILCVFDVKIGKLLVDEICWVKFIVFVWIGEEGFFYLCFFVFEVGQVFQVCNYNQVLWFYCIGMFQDEDELVYVMLDYFEYGYLV